MSSSTQAGNQQFTGIATSNGESFGPNVPLYIPGYRLTLTNGMSAKELARNGFPAVDKVRAKGGNMGDRQFGLLLLNYTPCDYAFAVCHPLDTPSNPGAFEYQNERQIANFVVPKGTSGFVPLPPLHHIASVTMFDQDRDGTKRNLTSRGWKLEELQGIEIDIDRGREPGTVTYTCTQQNITQFCIIKNNTKYWVRFTVTKPAHDLSNDSALAAQLGSKEPDYGGTVIVDMEIGPKCKGEVAAPPCDYHVFLLQTRTNTDALSQDLFGRFSNAPTRKEYVQVGRTLASAGDNVFALIPEPPGEEPVLCVYPRNKCKPVDEDAVCNEA